MNDTDCQALLQAVLVNPADDLPRLMLADWLEERGESARAELIRCQIELWEYDGIDTGPEGGAAGPRHLALRRRERELLRSHCLNWIEGVKALCVQFKEEGPTPTLAVGLASKQTLDAELVWSRGLISAITLPCATFCGGPCEWCEGVGLQPIGYRDDCTRCLGTGRLPGHAEALFRSQPITAVTLNLEPLDMTSGGRRVWWFAEELGQPSILGTDHRIPPALAAHMPGERRRNSWDYESPAAARAALSLACVLHGRSLAGLPDFP